MVEGESGILACCPPGDRYWEAVDMLEMGLRLGSNPQAIGTTTPRPLQPLKALMAEASTVVTRGSTYDNASNLAPQFLTKIRERYEGTTLGRQELYAELMDETPGSLWQRALFDLHRVDRVPSMRRVVVGLDPSISDTGQGDEAGIVAAGLGGDDRYYAIDDRSGS
jgi:phage terminase large subunit-like protein